LLPRAADLLTFLRRDDATRVVHNRLPAKHGGDRPRRREVVACHAGTSQHAGALVAVLEPDFVCSDVERFVQEPEAEASDLVMAHEDVVRRIQNLLVALAQRRIALRAAVLGVFERDEAFVRVEPEVGGNEIALRRAEGRSVR
jgi:hypothetical protein